MERAIQHRGLTLFLRPIRPGAILLQRLYLLFGMLPRHWQRRLFVPINYRIYGMAIVIPRQAATPCTLLMRPDAIQQRPWN